MINELGIDFVSILKNATVVPVHTYFLVEQNFCPRNFFYIAFEQMYFFRDPDPSFWARMFCLETSRIVKPSLFSDIFLPIRPR